MSDPHLPNPSSTGMSTRRTFLRGALATGAVLTIGGALAACSGDAANSSGAAGPVQKGGNLRVAILGGGAADTLDAHHEVSQPDALRVMALPTVWSGSTTRVR